MYPRYPGYLPLPTALSRAPGPVPNRNAIDNGQGTFLPEYLPPGSASFIPYNMNPTRYNFISPDKSTVLFSGVGTEASSAHDFTSTESQLAESQLAESQLAESQLAPVMQFSLFVLNSAANLQRLPPSQATHAIRGLITESQLLSENMSELKAESDIAAAQNRIALINEIVYVATSVSPEVLNAAIAAKSIADFLLMRDSAQELKQRLNIHSVSMRNPMSVRNPRITEKDIADSALRVDAAGALVQSAKNTKVRSKLTRKDILKLEKALVDEDLRHIRLKLAFLQQARKDVGNVAQTALNIVKSPNLDSEIVGLAKALPESTILQIQTSRLLPHIVAGAKQEMLRRLATTAQLPETVAIETVVAKNNPDCGCGPLPGANTNPRGSFAGLLLNDEGMLDTKKALLFTAATVALCVAMNKYVLPMVSRS